ncbi:hypothetical protein TrLO_g3497 [Triparma laevis f. longispina]|uniref:Kinesin light chain n=1 Tax=Triparma laevis f. longispina TaxID=1714387 RepID=A0A9W7E6V8_9STRA|nr:hypothetical protein TrLO_g3497 [Triparma laevis f. longispina]
MPEEKKVQGKKKKQQGKKTNPRKREILDACADLGMACNYVSDFDDARPYLKRGREGYEEQLRRENEKALEASRSFINTTCSSLEEVVEKMRDLMKRMERALGEENVVTLETLNELGCELRENGEYEEAKEVHERCLAGRIKVLGEDHGQMLMTLNNLGIVYNDGLKNYIKGLEYYKRALGGKERTFGKNHP